VATGLRIKRKGLKTSSGRLLPVALITALITFLPSVLMPGMLPAGHAVDSTYTITWNGQESDDDIEGGTPEVILEEGEDYGNGENATYFYQEPHITNAPTFSVSSVPTDPQKGNYNFAGWFTLPDGQGVQVSPNSPIQKSLYSTEPQSEHMDNGFKTLTFFAHWTADENNDPVNLTVTYNSQSGSSISNGSTSTGGSIESSPGTPTRNGYTFNGWFAASTGGSAITFPYTHAQTADFTLYAQWTANTLAVTYNSQGGSSISNGSTSVGGSISTSPGTPTRSGYTFNGWFAASTGGSAITFPYTHAQTADFTLYAQWTANTLAVTYNSQSGSSISNGSTSTGGSIESSPGTPTRNGYTFNGWFAASTGGSAITFPYTHAQTADFTLYAQWTAHSSDASLSGLTVVNAEDSPISLSPTFAGATTSYTASVDHQTTGIRITPTRNQANATITINGIDTWNEIFSNYSLWIPDLAVGSNTITVVVTAQNGTTTRTYTVVVTRAAAAASSDSTLSALTVSSGTSVSLSPTFASGTTSYTASVGNSTSSITVTPTRNQANASITVNGTSVTSGSASGSINLSVGSNTITVVVTAQNASTSTYTVTVTRAAQANNTNTVTWNGQGATTASSGGSTTYTNGSSVSTIPTTAPQKTGHTFVGWFTAASSGKQITNGSFTPASPYVNQTFYAHWTVNRTSSVGTWAWTNQSTAGSRKWHALATSADGSKLYAGVDDGGSLYRSTDFGVTWSVIADTSGKNWFSIASNIDGTKVAAVDRGGHIWTSTDSGSTWTQRSVGAVRNWESIASSSDGSKLVAVASNGDSNGYIYTSSNSGVSWSSNLAPAGTNKFTGVASSNDGTYLAATTWANGIYTSSNSGQTWTARTLPVPNSGSTTYLQAVASSGDGSRLVTGSRTRAGGSNGGVIFTSADYGVTWKAFSQTNLDYINFTSNGDGSRLAATVYDQTGVSTSADYGATWSFQSVGLSGEIPIASNIDGSLLFVGAYGGNLWTGKIPNARVAAVLPASTTASLAATASTPATELSFSASSAAAAVTVTPITNPATEAATPFSAAQASVFDISVVNVTGQVTVCVDGGPNVRLWHYTNGAWVDVTTSQSATQTCGLTSSFSPFATALSVTVSLPVTNTVSNAASERREAEKQSARTEIASTLQSAKDLTVESFAKAEIRGVTEKNLAAVQAEILALPEESRADINQILKVARKFEVVGNIASNQVMRMTANSFVEIGLIPATSKSKVALMAAIRKLPASARDTYAEIKAAIEAETARIKSRNDRLAAIVNRKTTKSTQK
jgi:uncharacterized repeat protein (TIGR02543 family)